jgi:hypothetical protein
MSAERMRARKLALFAEIDAFAPGLLDVLMAAIAGDPAALAKIGQITSCPAEPTQTLQ